VDVVSETVIIYGKMGCPFSIAAKLHYEAKGACQYYDILESKSAYKEFLKYSPDRLVPVIIEGDKVTIGFNGT